MARKPTQSAIEARTPTHQSIAADIAAFRKRGGRIEVLGTTPMRANPASPFRSSAEQRKPPTPIKRSAAR
jgi:S-adenosylmethionine:tRNA-ribosyltransferase-isomerase (queuine synthetase)